MGIDFLPQISLSIVEKDSEWFAETKNVKGGNAIDQSRQSMCARAPPLRRIEDWIRVNGRLDFRRSLESGLFRSSPRRDSSERSAGSGSRTVAGNRA